jgi:DNA-binding beta-propeller fold protein YncE/class 3 adenylate cyclase/predicted Ser/Thr protein kinase
LATSEVSEFGVLLQQHRAASGLTQEELAERSQLSARGISNLERGVRRLPHQHTVRQLADALELSGQDRAEFEAAGRRLGQSVSTGSSTPSSTPAAPAGPVTGLQTFLFADVRGYTRFTSERGDEAAAQLVERFAALARETVSARGGKVIELRGDEALVVFGSVRNALHAALELQARFAEATDADPMLPLPVGIGLDAGESVPVSGGYRGGALNLAARLCGLAGRGEVLASEAVAHLARKVEGLVYIERGPVEIKGLVEPVRVVQIVEASDTAAGAGAVSTARPASAERSLPIGNFLGSLPSGTIVGREEEVAAIRAAVDTVMEGTGQLLLLAGQRGVGKTRLAQEATLIAHKRGLLVACGRCYEAEQTAPYFPFLEALATAYARAPASLRFEAPRRWPYLAALLPDEIAAPTPDPDADDKEIQRRLFRAAASFLSALAAERPVVLLVDDLQWADEGGLRLLAHLARHTRGQRVLMVGAYRDTELSRDQILERWLRDLVRERLAERVSVRRLPAEGTAAMVAATIGDMETTEEFTEFVHSRTKGVPLFVEEMLRSVGGHYRLIREIGAGGMGRVFQAIDTRTGESVAAKIMFTSKEAAVDATLRFEQEGAVLGRLQHPNIVKVYGTFMEEHASCIVMELLEGGSLAEILRSGHLDLARTKRIVQQVAAALAAAHARGIVHRDIKPDNIMVVGDDEVRVTDFGIARVLRPEATIHTMVSTGITLGTPLYMAPEQIDGRKVDGRADVYAVGAVLYQMVTGRPLFEGMDAMTIAFKHMSEVPRPPGQINKDLPDDWEALILKSLAKDPADRYQTASALEQAISALGTESKTTLPAAASGQRFRTPFGRPKLRVMTPWPRPKHGKSEGIETDGALAVQGPVAQADERLAVVPALTSPTQPAGAAGISTALTSRVAIALGVVAAVLIIALFAYGNRAHHSRAGTTLGSAIAGWGSTQDVTLNSPAGVAVDRQGVVYVADQLNSTIRRLSPQGVALASWGRPGTGPGQLHLPTDVAVDGAGNVYVADSDNHRIQKFSPAGRALAQWPVSGQVTALAVDPHGTVYAADGSAIERFSPAGKRLARWPNAGAWGVAVDGAGNVYVTDSNTQTVPSIFIQKGRVVKLSPAGKTLAHWGKPGSAKGQFNGPKGLVVDDKGNVYVADHDNGRIQKFSPRGVWLAQWGSVQVPGPSALAVDEQGNVYVADVVSSRILKFSATGQPLAQWGPRLPGPRLAGPSGTAVDASGNIYVTDTGNNRLEKLSPAGELLAVWGGNGRFNAPYGVAVDTHGAVYVTESLGNRLDKISPAGTLQWRHDRAGAEPLSVPSGVAVDARGRVYVADTGNSRIAVFSASGRYLTDWGSAGSGPQLQEPSGVAVARDGTVYVADSHNNRILQFSPAGRYLNQQRGAGPGAGGTQAGQFYDPKGMAVDPRGNIYVSDTGNNRIQQLARDGRVLAVVSPHGIGMGQFNGPSGIAVDRHGNAYVADTGNNRVLKFAPSR